MAIPRLNRLLWLAPLLAFLAGLAALTVLNRSTAPVDLGGSTLATSARAGSLPGASTDERIGALQSQVRSAPSDPDGYANLGLEYLQKVRESGDPAFYSRAGGVLRRAL